MDEHSFWEFLLVLEESPQLGVWADADLGFRNFGMAPNATISIYQPNFDWNESDNHNDRMKGWHFRLLA
jgi:hypothetical protein